MNNITDLGLMEIAMYRLLEIWSEDSQYTTVEQIAKYAKKQGYSQKTYDNMRRTVSVLIDKGFAEIDNQRSMVIPLKETLEEQEEKKPERSSIFGKIRKSEK